jgi:hypothetical protein
MYFYNGSWKTQAGGTSGGSGTQGFQGWQGSSGADGSAGFQGFQGAQGFQGWQGSSGADGSSGFQGYEGFQGFQGFTGPAGETGAGFQGFQGWQGASGADGSSGFQGYEGFQGFQGFTGPAGDPGGPQGFQGPDGPSGLGGVNISIASGIVSSEAGMTGTGRTYTDDSGTYDIYQFNAQTGLMSGSTFYVVYLGTIYDPLDTLTFRKITSKNIVRAIDPTFQECQTSLGPGALVLDTVTGGVAPVDLMTVNVDNTTLTDFYDIFLIAGNANAFDAYADIEFEFIISTTTTPIFAN